MSDTINIQAILDKHGYIFEEGYMTGNYQKELHEAIKEIVEAVVDKCGEVAEAIEGYNLGFSGNAASVDKQSIENVKQLINYG